MLRLKLLLASILALAIFLPVANAATPPLPRANPVAVSAAAAPEAGLLPQPSADLQKKFTLEGFFAGETVARGTIFSKIAGASRSFQVTTSGTWDGNALTLVETYRYAAGDQEQRIWRFRKTGEGTYLAENNESLEPVNVGINGRVASLKYRKMLSRPGKDPVKVTFDEVWTLRKDGVLESRTELKKVLRVGREAINFARAGNEAALNTPGF
ncbi:MAG: DUF3833 family protein [Rhizobiales bacterium]|nr:DUF3833 family protein [Hyphomicrobiales bacterium]